MYRKSNQE